MVARGGGVVSVFGEHGVRVSGATHDVLLLGLSALGRGDRLQSVPPVAPIRRQSRVSYAHSGVLEWYANGPLGLEQGLTLSRRPSGSGPLRLAVGSVPGGERARLGRDGSDLALLGSTDQVLLSYSALVVTDARGRRLPARIAQSGATVLLSVDDAGARYPITIDPFVGPVESTSVDGAAGDLFGSSVAISGDTMVVGAPDRTVGLNAQQGAVFVFSDSSGAWQQTDELVADNGAEYDQFGYSVAISGSTIVVGSPFQVIDHALGSDAQGAVYVFSHTAGRWQQTAELTASDGQASDWFGYSVAISGVPSARPTHSAIPSPECARG